ncbi:MAG: hypothetical protein FIA95_09550, partial [Gemmatimonadetes bacterium]|nr:hypothetical protein [Gemmatimonadota bacterium]
MMRRLSAAVAPGTLERLAVDPHPLGLRGGKARYSLLRETYFDTRQGVLAENDLSLCLRVEASGGELLELTRTAAVTLGGVGQLDILTVPVIGGGLYATLRGESELATVVRSLVDPAALRPIVALDIDRETRDLLRGLWGKPVCTAHFDRILAQRGGATRGLEEIVLIEPEGGPQDLDSLGRELQRCHGSAPDGRSVLQRALEALDRGEAARPATVREVRMVLLLHRAGSVALMPRPKGLSIPSARGSGEELAASLAGEILGTVPTGADMELAGFVPSREATPDLEVWLHECPPGRSPGPQAVWIPLGDLLERVGNPGLREPALVASLLLLCRSDAGRRLLAVLPARQASPVILPLPDRASVPAPGEDLDDFLNVELSILAFNQRVLELAEDARVPLLERVRFLSIFASNMDEYFVVRVGRLKRERARGGASDDTEIPPEELLDCVAVRAQALSIRHYACLRDLLLPALAKQGVRLRAWSELGLEARRLLSKRFEEEI